MGSRGRLSGGDPARATTLISESERQGNSQSVTICTSQEPRKVWNLRLPARVARWFTPKGCWDPDLQPLLYYLGFRVFACGSFSVLGGVLVEFTRGRSTVMRDVRPSVSIATLRGP